MYSAAMAMPRLPLAEGDRGVTLTDALDGDRASVASLETRRT